MSILRFLLGTGSVPGLMAIGLVLLVGHAPLMSSLGLGGVGLWFLYYRLAVWRAAGPSNGSGLPSSTL